MSTATGAPENAPEQTGWPTDWQQTEATATAPNEQVFLRLVGDHTLSVRFAPGYYQRVRTDQLEQSLAQAVRLLVVDRSRAFYDALSRERGEQVRPGIEAVTPEDVEYRRRLAELPAEARSADGRLSIALVGMTQVAVRIAPGTLTALDEASFCAQAQAAGLALLQQHLQAFYRLKFDVYVRPLLEELTARR